MSLHFYNSSVNHLLAELERIEILILGQVTRARQQNQKDKDFQGLYISEQEFTDLLNKPIGLPRWATDLSGFPWKEFETSLAHLRAEITQKMGESLKRGIQLRLPCLQENFSLSNYEVNVLLTCLAPELDLRYERIFAYLQDDITKKRPSIDFICNLLCSSYETKIEARQLFNPTGPLFRYKLLEIFEDPNHHHPTLLGRHLKCNDRIVNYLFDQDGLDSNLYSHAQVIIPRVELSDLVLPEQIKQILPLLGDLKPGNLGNNFVPSWLLWPGEKKLC